MPHLAIGQENTAAILALYAVDANGFLYNPASVEFRIVELASGTQVFPASGLEDVTEFGTATGIFPAWDVALDQGWTPAAGTTPAAHRIDWTFLDTDGVTERSWSQEFDVTEEGTGIPFWTYVSPLDVRNEGVTRSQLSNERLVSLIKRVQAYIERVARQPFRPVRHTLMMDGNGSPTLFLNVPIIGIERLRANYSTADLAASSFRVYASTALAEDGGWLPHDNRRNPKIRLLTDMSTGIYSGVYGGVGRFGVGTQPHEIKGVFGYVEANGQTPELIKNAALRLVLANTPLLTVGGSTSSEATAGPIKSEKTDRHEIVYADSGSSVGPDLGSALATSREVEEILASYRGPVGIGAPATMWSQVIGL